MATVGEGRERGRIESYDGTPLRIFGEEKREEVVWRVSTGRSKKHRSQYICIHQSRKIQKTSLRLGQLRP